MRSALRTESLPSGHTCPCPLLSMLSRASVIFPLSSRPSLLLISHMQRLPQATGIYFCLGMPACRLTVDTVTSEQSTTTLLTRASNMQLQHQTAPAHPRKDLGVLSEKLQVQNRTWNFPIDVRKWAHDTVKCDLSFQNVTNLRIINEIFYIYIYFWHCHQL